MFCAGENAEWKVGYVVGMELNSMRFDDDINDAVSLDSKESFTVTKCYEFRPRFLLVICEGREERRVVCEMFGAAGVKEHDW